MELQLLVQVPLQGLREAFHMTCLEILQRHVGDYKAVMGCLLLSFDHVRFSLFGRVMHGSLQRETLYIHIYCCSKKMSITWIIPK